MSFGQRSNSRLQQGASQNGDQRGDDSLPNFIKFGIPAFVLIATFIIVNPFASTPPTAASSAGGEVGSLYAPGAPISSPSPAASAAPAGRALPRFREKMEFVMDRPDGKTGLSIVDAEINRACLPASIGEKHRDLLLIQTDGTGKSGSRSIKMKLGLSSSGAYLACSMAVEPARLCKPFYRQRLVARLKEYSAMRQKEVAIAAQSGVSGWRLAFVAEADGVEFGVPQDPAWLALGRPVAEALRELSSSGRILADDFGSWGLGVPEAVAPHLLEPTVTVQCL